MITEDAVRSALSQVRYPGFSRDIVSFGLVKGIRVEGADVTVSISLATRDPAVPRQVHADATAALQAIPGIGQARLDFDIKDPPAAAGSAASLPRSSIPGVKRVIAVASAGSVTSCMRSLP